MILLNDPYLCKGSISHCNDWLVILPVFYEGERIAFASLFGHMMDVGGKVPGSQVSDRALDLGGGHPDPAHQDPRPGRAQRDRARRDPEQHADAGHEPQRPDGDHRRLPGGGAADRRDLRPVRARDVRGRVRRAARADAHRDGAHHPHVHPGGAAVVHRLGRRRRVRQRAVQDGAHDLARGRRLPCGLDGHGRPGARVDQLPHPRGPLQALPRDLHDHGVRSRDPLQRRHLRRLRGDAAGRVTAEPEVPRAALEPAQRPHATLRLHERRARAEGPRAVDGRGVRDEPVLRLLGERRGGRVLPVRRVPLRGPPRALRGGRAGRALVVAALPHDTRRVRGELLPRAHRELRPGQGHRRRRLAPRRHRDREDLRLHRARQLHRERRPRDDPALGHQRRPPRRGEHEDPDPRFRRGARARVQDRPGRRRGG